MRYAEQWTRVNFENLDLEKLLAWYSDSIEGKQFIENNIIKFELVDDAVKFKAEYQE